MALRDLPPTPDSLRWHRGPSQPRAFTQAVSHLLSALLTYTIPSPPAAAPPAHWESSEAVGRPPRQAPSKGPPPPRVSPLHPTGHRL